MPSFRAEIFVLGLSLLLAACTMKVDPTTVKYHLPGIWKSEQGTLHFHCSGDVDFEAVKYDWRDSRFDPFGLQSFKNASFKEEVPQEKTGIDLPFTDSKIDWSIERLPQEKSGKWSMKVKGQEWQQVYSTVCSSHPVEAFQKNEAYIEPSPSPSPSIEPSSAL